MQNHLCFPLKEILICKISVSIMFCRWNWTIIWSAFDIIMSYEISSSSRTWFQSCYYAVKLEWIYAKPILLNKSFWTVALGALISKSIPCRGEIKIINRRAIYFSTFWHLIHWTPLINGRDMVISLLVNQI